MTRGYMLDERALRKLAADHDELRHAYRNVLRELATVKGHVIATPRARQRFLNSSGEECPGYAVMEVTAGVRGGANAYTEERLTITKPTSTFNRLYLVNGPMPVADGKEGEGTWLMDDSAGRPVLYASGDGTPAWGESWGAKASQWTLAKNRPGFLVTGANNTTATNPYTSAVQEVVMQLIGKPTANVTAPNTCTINIYSGTAGSESDTLIDVSAYTYVDLDSTKFCSVSFINGKAYAGCYEP